MKRLCSPAASRFGRIFMADEFSKWQRKQPASSDRKPYEAKWRASHLGNVKNGGRGENPYLKEAQRDKIIFRVFLIGLLIVVGAVVLWYFLVVSRWDQDPNQ